jgi:hypothetical protein
VSAGQSDPVVTIVFVVTPQLHQVSLHLSFSFHL